MSEGLEKDANFKVCKKCFTKCRPDALFCTSCGGNDFFADNLQAQAAERKKKEREKFLEEKNNFKYCKKCTAANEKSSKFCYKCGNSYFVRYEEIEEDIEELKKQKAELRKQIKKKKALLAHSSIADLGLETVAIDDERFKDNLVALYFEKLLRDHSKFGIKDAITAYGKTGYHSDSFDNMYKALTGYMPPDSSYAANVSTTIKIIIGSVLNEDISDEVLLNVAHTLIMLAHNIKSIQYLYCELTSIDCGSLTANKMRDDLLRALKLQAFGESEQEISNVKNEYLRLKRDTEAEAKAKLQAERKKNGLCRHCGGSFKGLFKKTCKLCGKSKDY